MGPSGVPEPAWPVSFVSQRTATSACPRFPARAVGRQCWEGPCVPGAAGTSRAPRPPAGGGPPGPAATRLRTTASSRGGRLCLCRFLAAGMDVNKEGTRQKRSVGHIVSLGLLPEALAGGCRQDERESRGGHALSMTEEK